MKYLVLCVTLNILFFINTVYSGNVTIQAKYDRNSKSNHVNFVVKQSFHLSCNASEDVKVVVWKKEDKPVTEIDSVKNRIKQKNDGNTFILTIDNAVDDDAGNYTCIAMKDSKEEARSSIRVTSNMAVKVPSNVNVVEGEKLRIHCLIIGNPPPQLSWYFQNETFNASYSESDDRVIIEDDEEKDIPNAIFILNEVDMNDRGIYRCIGRSPVTGETAHSDSMVRIKDKYAALWPFLGICAEVIILCAIIFIYEKKRNKTELEESDTDQSPDQKNTPDHGKDSNLRHRQ